MTLYYTRNFDGAIECAKKTIELDPGFASAHRLASLAYLGKGMFAEAIAENQLWGEMEGNTDEASISLAHCYAVAGSKTEALTLIKSVRKKPVSSGNLMRLIALVYTALDDPDQAFTWLERCCEIRSETMCSIKIDPKLDRLRSDPRFVSILRKVGLEKET